jgi:lipopolysaccharide assembly outer membrane protein LptD (OstA)
MKKLFFLFILLFAQFSFAQIDKINPKTPPAKDAFFKKENSANAKPAQKVKYIHSDSTLRKPDMYGGNTFFDGNVEFQHNGAVLTANRVIYYDKENFVKAIGNVILVTSDGNRITAEEMEYDGETQRGIARRNLFLQMFCIMTE